MIIISDKELEEAINTLNKIKKKITLENTIITNK